MFKIDVYTELSETAIVTKRNVKTTVIAMLSAILGSVVGIMNLTILVMLKTELFVGKYEEKVKRIRKLEELIERRDMLQRRSSHDIDTFEVTFTSTTQSKVYPEGKIDASP